jgi:hypothetical protein
MQYTLLSPLPKIMLPSAFNGSGVECGTSKRKMWFDANDEKHTVTWSDHGGGKYDSKSVELPEHVACDQLSLNNCSKYGVVRRFCDV